MRPQTDIDTLNAEIVLVSEMMTLIGQGDPPPIFELRDCSEIFKRARYAGAVLEPMELLDVRNFLQTAGHIRGFLEYEHAEVAPSLRALAMPLYNLPELLHSIGDKITPDGQVSDTASDLLGHLRKEIARLTEGIKRDLTNMVRSLSNSGDLQDTFWTMRNSRYVLPVKSTNRGRVKGIIHDSSNSGETVFIEPFSILEQTNQLADYQVREREEVYRILRIVSAEVTREIAVLQSNEQILSEFDLIFAKARFALQHHCRFPNLTEPERPLSLVDAHHPILYFNHPEQSIPLKLRFSPTDRVLIVTGPNAGGKTTALKTVGLSVMMVQCAIPIPASPTSHFPVFSDIFVAIGDEQNVLAGESTFSSHMRRLRDILGKSTKFSLILLDELGTATDPTEGGALAVAILESLCARGALSIVSTHLSILKNWAEQNPNACNASFRLDPESHKPTYHLHIGLPGISEAIVVAESVGLPADVVARARELCPKGEAEASALISGLQRREVQMNEMLAEARRTLDEAQKRDAESRELLKKTEEERRSLQNTLLAQKEEEIRALRQEVEALLASQPSKEALDAERNRLKQKENEAAQGRADTPDVPQSELYEPDELHVGMTVFVPQLNDVGTVTKVHESQGEVKVQTGLISLSVKIKNLRRPSDQTVAPEAVAAAEHKLSREEQHNIKPHVSDAPTSVTIVGMRLDKAEEAVDDFLGRALASGLSKVRIVHGFGTGALRRGVQEYLRAHPAVKSYHTAAADDGGMAVTIVTLK